MATCSTTTRSIRNPRSFGVPELPPSINPCPRRPMAREMRKRKASAHTENTKLRKKRPFCAARDVATKAKSVQSNVRKAAHLEADYLFRIKHNAEVSSLLLLPFGIRSLIYRELLGDRVIHIGHSTILNTDREDWGSRHSWPKTICSHCKFDTNCAEVPRWFHNVCRKPKSIARDYGVFHSGDRRNTEYTR